LGVKAEARVASSMVEMAAHSIVVTAGFGRAIRLSPGDHLRISLPDGPQVADMFAFVPPDLSEVLSTEHTRSCTERLAPRVGEAFYSNRRRPMLRIVEDTSPGIHDLLLSACDRERYALLGHVGPHRSCVENLREALQHLDLTPPEIPSPVNLFENVVIGRDGSLAIAPPLANRGDSILLAAMIDVVIVVSACPMDIVPTNGADRTPKAISLEWNSGARAC
jgi:uncharacterized protein